MSMLYRAHREQPVLSLTKVNRVWDDAEQHSGVYDFYVFTGGAGEMIVGGKIANRQNLMDKDGPVPGEYRGFSSRRTPRISPNPITAALATCS